MFGGFVISVLISVAPIIVIGLILYLIYKRLKDKDNEKFEKRDW